MSERMLDLLRDLPAALGDLGHGDPDEPGRVLAADVVRWAAEEIARLRDERWAHAERRSLRWGAQCLLENARLAEEKGMAQLSQCSLEASETLNRLLDRQPLPPGPYAKG